MKLATVIVTWNGKQHLTKCLRTLREQRLRPNNIVIVDNASSDGTCIAARRLCPNAKVIRNSVNLGVARGWNIGLAALPPSTDIVVFLNQDVLLTSLTLANLARVFRRDCEIGIAGPKLLYPQSEIIQHAGGIVDFPTCYGHHRGHNQLDKGQYDLSERVDYVTGACLAIRMSLAKRLAGVDEWFSPAYYEDVDMCFRARDLGFGVQYVPESVAFHSESTSLRDQPLLLWSIATKNRLRFAFKHLPLIVLSIQFVRAEVERFVRLDSEIVRRAHRNAYLGPWSDLDNHVGLLRREVVRVILQHLKAISGDAKL